MKKVKLLLLIALITPTFLLSQEIDIVLIGGQSNATGQGYIRNIPNCFEIDTTVKLYYSKFLNRGEGSEIWGPLSQASGSKEKFGVELSLGTTLQGNLPSKRVALIKHTLSGSNLHTQWNPGNIEGEEMGLEYQKFITTVKNGLAQLEKEGYKPIIRAMVWQQGEADARTDAGIERSKNYAKNLNNLITSIRTEFNSPDMLFVYGEVLPLTAERFPARDLVRAGQIEVSEDSGSSYSLKGAILVESDDLQMIASDYKSPTPNDDVHLGTYGLLNLGERFAKEIIERFK